MTSKTGEVVLDINTEEFSLNGKVLGKTTTDISASDDLLIESLDKEIKRVRGLEQEEALKNGKPADEGSAKFFELECFKNNIGLNLCFVRKSDGFFYEGCLNESGLIDGVKTYSFEKDVDLWNFIEKVRSRNDLHANSVDDFAPVFTHPCL